MKYILIMTTSNKVILLKLGTLHEDTKSVHGRAYVGFKMGIGVIVFNSIIIESLNSPTYVSITIFSLLDDNGK